VSAPVERIAAAADRVASGRLETPLHSGGGAAEVDALAASLGRMRETLLAQIRAADEERRLLDTVLSGMREGLLAIGADGRVILANASLRRDLGLGEADLKGRPLVEVLRDPEAGEAFARTLDGRVESRVGLTVRFPAERTFELLVAPLDAPDGRPLGAMGIFLDVTRLQALERLRREFIADVSHEMRTPLASLKAAVENLEGAAGAEEADRSRFLAVVRRNAERMGALLDDLTDLSLIETGAITLHVELVGVREAVGDVLAALSGRATSRRIDLSVEAPAELKVSADRRRLDQILVNVVDNAIKFNRPGGGVRIRAWADPAGGALVAVEDTGPGIQPPELEKVFQRFYRRDPSRSREAGGTGLGLAIVKHLMRLHGGSVHAENRAEGGARIVLRFPRPDQP
jgi:two-component system phosphate regulon sensor histidine kinase PhoR